ncbi:MAG TPA: fatty acid desaturase [Stellaceae bacterium]|jgi:fatty acid desaturase|nr:fatty acid desaturase [Stellaceae bacterium]
MTDSAITYAAPETSESLMTAAPDATRALSRNILDGAALQSVMQRSDRQGAMRFGTHVVCMAATGTLVWFATPVWYLLIPAMALHGVTVVTMFAPLHECVHRTAFASRTANVVVAWIAGVLCVYNSTYYWYYHSWHHRYTQDPARDPELMYPKARTRFDYVVEISGVMFWVRRAIDYPSFAMGRLQQLPFVPVNARRKIMLSMSGQLLVYAAGAASIALGETAVLYFWLLPLVIAQPLLRALLVVEHTGCSQDANGLTNTRTTLAGFPIRLLMWNMPYHAEHHLYPSVPFHHLPALHRRIENRLVHVARGYIAANQQVLNSL